METPPPPAVARYAEQVAVVSRRALGSQLSGAYLHGSTVLGAFAPSRSDVDVLLVVSGPVPRAVLESLGFALGRDRLRSPSCGLELDVLTAETAAAPERPTPFQLVMSSGQDGHRVTLGEDHGPYEDGVLHLAMTRTAGLALAGPPPAELIAPVPREIVLNQLLDELDWSSANASTAYQALGAARAWMYAEEDRIGSKLDAERWARGRGHDRVLACAAEFQRGCSEEVPAGDDVAALLEDARAAVERALRRR